jgi:uncharacterized protein with PIN domain
MRFWTELAFTITTTSRWTRWYKRFKTSRAGVAAVSVETDGEEKLEEGIALDEDEGWADDERGLRCAECAEKVRRASIGVVGAEHCGR